ncbi:DUF3987 domain-containing protein [Leucobacter viscericola]|uniref:DUF3987 domain-containing protein n=2 Tax=Leucobacter viscericola TaxID=2714935 RepID=A0A6G7XJA2_9MICO|nr:DUF3987 domain-containing protein [Leucobacter viscericola]
MEGWQEAATTDPLTIQQWFTEKPYSNYGIRTGLANNIIVIDLDGEEARKWWKSTGIEDSSAIVYSPRKDGGVHHYFRVYDVEIGNSRSKLHPGVDVRGEGGLVVGPGSRTSEGVYTGSLKNIPDAPQALLDLIPERQSYKEMSDEEAAELAGVEKVAEPSESELADLSHIQSWLLALPRKWSAGDGWHDTVFRSSCWLWRMVRTPSYALTEDKALEIMLTCTPVWPEWSEDRILEQWESARESTRGQFADPPAEQLPEILDFVESVNLLPAFAPKSQRSFLEVVGDPDAKPVKLIEECLLAGLGVQQTASVIYGSKCSDRYKGGEYGLRRLYRDVEGVESKLKPRVSEAATTPAAGTAIVIDDAPATEPVAESTQEPLATIEKPDLPERPEAAKLLTESERRAITGKSWWGTDYLEWAKEITSVYNGPYHRMNRWFVLSAVFSTVGIIPYEGGSDKGLNIYGFVIGDTTTGKSESLRIMNSVLRTCFTEEDDPDIGGDPSPSALGAKLIERDGKATLFNKDEAHGQIAEMKKKDYLAGLSQALTLLYDGEVPKMLRTTNKEVSDKRARTYFSIHYMGTFEGVTDVLEPSDWESGFLPRFVWAIGDEHQRTREAMRPRIRQPGRGREIDPRAMQKQWAAQFRSTANRIAPSGEPAEMEIDDFLIERFVTCQERMYELADEQPEMKERLYPSVKRMSDAILKAACLVALSEGRRVLEETDLLLAIEQGEEWFGNLLHLVTATDSSPFVRSVAKLEKVIRSAGGEMRMENVYRRSPMETKGATDTLVAQLVAEGRAKRELQNNGDTQILKLIGGVT